MTKAERISRRKQRHLTQERNSRMTYMILGGATLLIAALIGGVILIGRTASESQTTREVKVSTKAMPANAEQNGRAWGPKDAPIKIEEFVDYQCPSCQAFALQYEAALTDAFAKTGKVRYEIHNFPFKGPDSVNAAKATYCAADQNKFWQMHTSLFMNLPQVHLPGVYSTPTLAAIAGKLGMDQAAFEKCLNSETYSQRVEDDYKQAGARQVDATPTFIINGKKYTYNSWAVEDFKRFFAEVAPDVKFD